MADNVRDRVLVLRILYPKLHHRLREKMELQQQDAQEQLASLQNASSNSKMDQFSENHQDVSGGGGSSGAASSSQAAAYCNLDGVECYATADGSTLWAFVCDGIEYPARLVNLPCPVEVHKTHDHAMFYKSSDIGQMLIVYENDYRLEEAEKAPGSRLNDFPSYYHSGLTPPMKRVVERRYMAREHKNVPPPREEVRSVEKELIVLINGITRDTAKKSKKGSAAAQASELAAQAANDAANQNFYSNREGVRSFVTNSKDDSKNIEHVVEEVVDYEPWMDEHSTFDDMDTICQRHPELWLTPEEVKKCVTKLNNANKEQQNQKNNNTPSSPPSSNKNKSPSRSTSPMRSNPSNPPPSSNPNPPLTNKKKDKKSKKDKKKKKEQQQEAENKGPHLKKGIPSRKAREAAAAAAAASAASKQQSQPPSPSIVALDPTVAATEAEMAEIDAGILDNDEANEDLVLGLFDFDVNDDVV